MNEATKALGEAVLLDRDGVLNLDRAESVTTIDALEVAPGAREGCARLRAAGYRLLVVTNQACVGRGQLTMETLDTIDAELNRRLGGAIDAFFVCPHDDRAGCRCRKPAPGLLEQAVAAWRLEPAGTWLVGDDTRDVEAALELGCRVALVRAGKGLPTSARFPDVPVFDDLDGFARALTDGQL